MDIRSITLSNTLSRSKEVLKPITPGLVRVYQCGPTVYWTQHIGNMRAAVISDLLVRTLRSVGYNVKFVRNYTDVGHLTSDSDLGEDKMSKGARREGVTPDEIANRYIRIFEEDVQSLHVVDPDAKPRATEYIKEMIGMVQILLDKGFAYQTPLAIYFDTSKVSDYTKLSGQILEHNIEDAGKGVVHDTNKKHPTDFSLWFFKSGVHEHALQTWRNPFSVIEGFPGWHLECSAMIKKNLGETIDIHMGGIEHIPVHHTNEIAQSESANSEPLAHIWMHYEHLLVDGRKMSKSEGTSYVLSDIIERGFSPEDLRYLFLTAHYKSKQNFTWEALEGARTALKKISGHMGETSGSVNDAYKVRFRDCITNDLDTPGAVALVWELLKDSSVRPEDKTATLLDFDTVLGLGLALKKNIDIPPRVAEIMAKRERAREEKDWALADTLRAEIADLGYAVLDTPHGQEINKN